MSHPKNAAKSGAALLALAVCSSNAALAQVAPVQQGHALDANPQVGAGGTNGGAAASAYQPVNGNDVFTGNVTGLGYFHGNVPYGSAFQFHSNLPTSSLNGFTRSSTGGYNPPANLGYMRTSYTSSTLVSTNNGSVNAGGYSNSTVNHLESALTGAGSVSPNTAAGAANASRVGISTVPFSQAPNFQDFQKLSSQRVVPSVDETENDQLFGLRRTLQTAPVNAQTLAPEPPEKESLNAGPMKLNAPFPSGPAGARPADDEPIDDSAMPEKPKGLGERQLVNDRIRDKPIRSALITPRLSRTPGEFPDAIGKFEPIHVSAPFEEQLASLQYNPKAQSPTELAGGTGVSGVPDNTRFSPLTASGSSLTKKSPADAKKTAADAKKNQRSRVVIVDGSPMVPETPRPDREPGSPGTPSVAAAATQNATELPPTPSASDQVVPAADYIARAAAELKDGRYLQAADTYQAALRVEPSNSDALVGRAHAEFAGGLYESAVFDLKYYFNVHPQKIADRYNLISLFSGKRVDYLEKDLQELERKSNHSQADFLLAYLYYQTGREDDLKFTLNRWSKLQLGDPWPAELQKVWAPEKAAETQPAK